ncbi:MAG TPA: hypothetical protein VHD56_00400 [Tepidisphaeraceae bacterium]|nr:hypothetical protein [Tepidisphaeraceae bacterium]
MNRQRVIPLLLIAITLLTFALVLRNGWVIQDDPEWIANNPRLHPPTFENFAYWWTHSMQGLYVPGTYSLWFALAAMGGPHPVIFHLGSLILHVVSVCLVWDILKKTLQNDIASAIGAAVFAVHPLQVETVAWASGMKDVLAGMLSLAMIQQYILFSETAGKHRFFHYGVAFFALLMAMLAKPSASIAPLIAAAIDWMLLKRRMKSVAAAVIPLLLVTLPLVLVARNAQTIWAEANTALWMRPLIAGDAVAFYLCKLVWPFRLANDYGRTPDAVMDSGVAIYSWIVPVAVGICLLLNRGRLVGEWCGFLIFLVGLLPVLGFTPFMYQVHSTVADHYMYLPMFGIAVAAAAAIRAWPKAGVYRVSSVVLVLLAARSMSQIGYWRDSVSLFGHAMAVNPRNPALHGQYGIALVSANRSAEAVEQFQIVANAQPSNPNVLALLGRAQAVSGRLNEAFRNLSMAAILSPNDPSLVVDRDNVRRRLDSPATTQ